VQLCRRHCAYEPTNNTTSHNDHEKINSWASFSFLYEYGALWAAEALLFMVMENGWLIFV